jgi:hypothetical protein
MSMTPKGQPKGSLGLNIPSADEATAMAEELAGVVGGRPKKDENDEPPAWVPWVMIALALLGIWIIGGGFRGSA